MRSEEIAYEAPAVEQILDSEDIERQVQYAGGFTFPPPQFG